MLGLLYILAAIIYGIVLIAVTSKAYRWGLRKWGKPKAYLAGLGGFLLIYLPVFWDHIPTLVAHQYYCSTQAGFTANNSGGKTGQAFQHNQSLALGSFNENNASLLARDLVFTYRIDKVSLLPINRTTEFIVDTKQQKILAQYVNFQSGYGNFMTADGISKWKVWLYKQSCEKKIVHSEINKFKDYKNALISARRGDK